jgi:galactokinase
MRCDERFQEIYKREPEAHTFCPYRVCPIGAHVDHNLGKITGFAIDQGITFAYDVKRNGVVEVTSLQFPKRAQWHVLKTPPPERDWADYLRGATVMLGKRYPLRFGLCGVIDGSLPIGGLSSSAAVTISFLVALARVNDLHLARQEIIDLAYAAERDYVGVSVGKLDQSCEVLSQKNSMLYLDTLDGSYETIPVNPVAKPFQFGIFFSGLERSLVNSNFNTRVDELRAGVYALEAFAGRPYGKFEETAARRVPPQIYQKYRERLPEPWRKRCDHWYSEQDRVERGAQAWREGDIERYGRLSFDSGMSSIINWESGAPEQIKLYEILRKTDGVYGGRFAGAGFRGCCIAIVDPSQADAVLQSVSEAYLKEFPHLEGKYSCCICNSADGIEL